MRAYKLGPLTVTFYSWPAMDSYTLIPAVRGVEVDIDICSLHASFEVWKDTP